jgi:hypothetical protein
MVHSKLSLHVVLISRDTGLGPDNQVCREGNRHSKGSRTKVPQRGHNDICRHEVLNLLVVSSRLMKSYFVWFKHVCRAGWSRGNASDLCSWDARFESLPRQRLSWLEFYSRLPQNFLSKFCGSAWISPRPLQNYLQFIICNPTIRRCVV